ncbi:hypothetical protein E4U39_004580 [Claviceps sp. Clav50 group G5]|nr:hypothetical protein E4U39_004580 [Claviceps sp. Clav50 group G5]
MHALSLLTLLLPIVAVNGYTQCDCQTASDDGKWKYDPVLSHWVCYHSYGNHIDGRVSASRELPNPNTQDGCVATEGTLDGDAWQQMCIAAGVQNGYYAFDKTGAPITNVPAMTVAHAAGQCPK